MKKLTGKKVAVIGGSRGTGRAIVKSLVEEGAEVLVIARDAASLADLAGAFSQVRTMQADATDATTIKTVFQDRPDVVVLVAGEVPPTQPFYELDWEKFSSNWNSDVKAAFLIAKHAITAPIQSGTQVIFISGGPALFGSPISGGFAGSKRMQMFLANYAQEASNRLQLGLRFLALAPWRIMQGTGTGEVAIPGYAAYLGIPEKDFAAGMTLAQTKEDVAAAVVAWSVQPPTMEEGNVFVSSGAGVIPELEVRQVLLAKK